MDGLKSAFENTNIPVQVIGEPPVFDIFFTDQEITTFRDTLSNDKVMVQRFNNGLLERGIFRPDSKFYISSMHSDQDIQKTVNVFEDVASTL
jgi:glutamate-1-semialdehyde 2,1-aminomutase